MFIKACNSCELYLGDRYSPRDFIQLGLKCNLVVNCTSNIEAEHEFPLLRVSVDDNGNNEELEKLSELLPNIVSTIVKLLNDGKVVLVHCNMGRQRSCAVVAAVLMIMFNYSYEQAIAHIKRIKRDAFFPDNNFLECLRKFKRV